MKNLFALFVLFFFAPCIILAQEVTVTDAETNIPLVGVNVISIEPKKVFSTDINGKVDVSAFKNSDKIEFRYIGYKTLSFNYQELKNKDFKVALQPSSFNLNPMVVSATKWKQATRNVPAKITSISPKETNFFAPQTTADLLETSGEVFIQKSQQGGGSPMIRGFATNRLLMAVDGVRMNTAIFRSGNIQNIISLDPFALESTEILFGPGSVTYGSDALGAVMSFTTASLAFNENPDSNEAKVSGQAVFRTASANNEISGNLLVKVGHKKWASVTSISSQNYGDLRMGTRGPTEYKRSFIVNRINNEDVKVENPNPLVQEPTGFNQVNVMQKIGFKPNEKWTLSYNLHVSEIGEYSRYDRLIELRGNEPRSAVWNYGPQRWYMNHFKAEHNANTMFFDDLSVNIAHQYFEESRIDRGFNRDLLRTNLEKVNAYSINFDFSKTISERINLYYGAESVLNEVNSFGSTQNINTNNTFQTPSRYPNATWQSHGLYANLQYQITEKLSLASGVRYNQFLLNADFNTQFFELPFETAELNNGALTGSLGFVYQPGENSLISANFSSGFRAPNVDDIGKIFDSEPGAVMIPNPALGAENAYNAELGFAQIISEKIKLEASVFYTYMDNAMVRRNSTFNGQDSIIYGGELSRVQTLTNAAFAQVYGIQASLEAKLGLGFYLETKVNYQRGDEELDSGERSPLRHAAPLFGLARLGYKNGKFRAEIFGVYNGEISADRLALEEQGKPALYLRNENGELFSPSWYTLNLKTQYQINKSTSINAGIENFTDQRYRPYSSGLVAPGINFTFGFNVRF
jgi:hemoglobin/transferrin/lactoferrin receptor protein